MRAHIVFVLPPAELPARSSPRSPRRRAHPLGTRIVLGPPSRGPTPASRRARRSDSPSGAPHRIRLRDAPEPRHPCRRPYAVQELRPGLDPKRRKMITRRYADDPVADGRAGSGTCRTRGRHLELLPPRSRASSPVPTRPPPEPLPGDRAPPRHVRPAREVEGIDSRRQLHRPGRP